MPGWLTIILVYLGLQVVFVLIVQVFPNLLGSALTKKIEHSFDLKLEKAKAEMQSAYSTLKTSVDFASAGQSEYRAKTTASVEALWKVFLLIEKEFQDVTYIHMILTPEEIAAAVRGEGHSQIFRSVAEYRNDSHLVSKLERINAAVPEADRLFCGDRLWLLFYVTRAFCGRLGALMQLSLSERQYKDWRTDSGIAQNLLTIIPNKALEAAKQKPFFGIATLLAYLEAEFLREARRVMSGSEGLAESLSDIQAIMQLEHEKIAEAKARP